ncbi:MAG: CD225/dispanin family protein, partial [Actinomycetota bacterium]|nr:CD225/dispanin family protein [Actinomycetota bacterium]
GFTADATTAAKAAEEQGAVSFTPLWRFLMEIVVILAGLAAALFFLPLGLIAVVFSWRTGVWKRRDDLARARRNSRLALIFIIVTIIVGVLVYGGLLGALLTLGAFSSPQ